MGTVRKIALGLCALVVAVVLLQNLGAVETRFLFVSFPVPKAVLMGGMLLLGFVAGVLFSCRPGDQEEGQPVYRALDRTRPNDARVQR